MKTVRRILLVLTVISAVATIILIAGDARDVLRLRSSIQEKSRELDETRAEMSEVVTKQRGLQQSAPDLPDSLAIVARTEAFRKREEYRKRLHALKWEEHEQGRQLRKDEREMAEVSGRLKRRLLIFGGVTVVLLAGALLAGRAAIQS
jgi:uncharacterized coiled-coil DUF342 family protein